MKQKSIKNIRQEFKDRGIFYTPPELAKRLKEYVDRPIDNVYDPTCGAGNLLRVFPDEVKKYGQELDREQLELIDIPNFIGCHGDTLTDDKFSKTKFKCIVANPPFSVKWNPEELKEDIRFKSCPTLAPPSKADWAFMLHILYHLADDGVAVVLNSPGVLYRGQREAKIRRWFVESNYIDRVVNIPGNTFEDTAISTCIIVLKKDRDTTDIVFEDGERVEVIEQNEIAENDFNLSVNIYLEEEVEREKIDPVVLENEARRSFLERLRRELDFDKMVCEMEGVSIQPFIKAIRIIVNKYTEKPKVHKDEQQLSIFDVISEKPRKE